MLLGDDFFIFLFIYQNFQISRTYIFLEFMLKKIHTYSKKKKQEIRRCGNKLSKIK